MARNEKTIEGITEYAIYFDDIRVDHLVKSFEVNLGCDGGIGSASVDMLYAPMLYKTRVTDSQGFILDEDGIENMTNMKIFIKNIFNNKFILVFDGNIKGKSLSRSQGSYALTFTANDYMTWLNRTIVPLAIPVDQSLTASDKLRWKAQGINPQDKNIAKFDSINDINFRGETIKEIVSKVLKNTISSNKIYSDPDSVAAWDDAAKRIAILGDIDENLRKKKILDFVITNDVSVSSIYVMINDLIKTLLFEFYQDRDGVIKIKPPFWNEKVLKDHIIDPSLIISYVESVNWNNYFTRMLVTGGLEDIQEDSDEYAKSILTPVVAYALNTPSDIYTDFLNDVSYDDTTESNQIASWPTLRQGSNGTAVEQLQNILKELGYTEVAEIDGYFGALTRAAVQHFQKDSGLTIDGIVGGLTKTALKKKFQNSKVGNDAFLNGTTVEKKYGVSVYEAQQPLIKFSSADIITDGNKDACAALVDYSRFMLNLLNSSVTVANVQLIAMPWLRPGFNTWVDPLGIDKVFYVSAVTHQGGAQMGVFTNARLSFGRSSSGFTKDVTMFGSLKAKKDNVFVNQIFSEYKPEALGSAIGSSSEFVSMRNKFSAFYNSSSNDIIKADSKNPHFYELYGIADVFGGSSASTTTTAVSTLSTKTADKYLVSSWPSILRKGSKGSAVTHLQTFLTDMGYSLGSIDGDFGSKTYTAVVQFQKDSGLSADGVVGPNTKSKIKEREGYIAAGTASGNSYNIDSWSNLLYKGCSGQSVKDLQTLLLSLGYTEVGTVDGAFGSKTESAVKRFQKDNNLSADGVVGPKTKALLKNKVPGSNSVSVASTLAATTTSNLGTAKIFNEEYTLPQIQSKLTGLYSSSPSVIKTRRDRLKTIISQCDQYIQTHYIMSKDR
jgi:peptidoglycan hydrolase-like protein with peptidoglycan-binding domain